MGASLGLNANPAPSVDPSAGESSPASGQTSPSAAPTAQGAPALTVQGQTLSAIISGSSTGYIVGHDTTIFPGGSPVTVSGVTVSISTFGSGLVINGQTSSLPTGSVGTIPAFMLNGHTLSPTIISGTPAYSLAPGESLVAGGPALTLAGSSISLAPSGSAIVVNGNTTPFSGSFVTPAPALTLNGQTFTPTTISGTPQYSIAPGKTLVPGASAATVNGSTISMAPSGSAVVVNGQTSSFPPATTGIASYIASGVGATGTGGP